MQEKIFLEQLAKLVEMRTVTGEVKLLAKALDYIETLVSAKVVKKRYQNKTAEVLILTNTDTMTPDVAYMVHVDVVGANDDQWQLRREGDKLYGRGTSDMKFSIPLGAALLNELTDRNSQLSFAFVITTDEEVGGGNGAGYLASQLKFRPKLLIVPDGGDGGHLIYKSKGYTHMEVVSQGVPAHGSMPWKGENALEPLIKLANLLVSEYERSNKADSWQTTLNIGYLNGGQAVNQVCPMAKLGLDFRFPEASLIDPTINHVKDLISKVGGHLELVIKGRDDGTYTDPELAIMTTFIESIEGVMVDKMVVRGTTGGSDAGFFAEYNIPILMTKSDGGDIHGNNEWLGLSSTLNFYKALQIFISRLESDRMILDAK